VANKAVLQAEIDGDIDVLDWYLDMDEPIESVCDLENPESFEACS
jgi:hypothetical protein